MSMFIQATPAPTPKSPLIEKMSVLLAGVFVIFAVAQLFGFEDLPYVIEAWHLPGAGGDTAALLAAGIVALEVLAVPFLLRMHLSPLMRIVSMAVGWLAGAWWLFVTIWQNTTGVADDSVGFLGSTIQLASGWWAVFFIASICALIAWASWGLWPARRK